MRFLALLQILFLMNTTASSNIKATDVRKLYYEAAEKKESSVKLSKMLMPINEKSAAIFVCYKGAAQMLEAKYVFNPITKLSRFKKGKTLIENAIKKEPDDLEMRFIRFSIQTNLPSFLGYNNWIENDKKVLLLQTPKTNDEDLKQKIINYLSKYCTKEELKKLKA